MKIEDDERSVDYFYYNCGLSRVYLTVSTYNYRLIFNIFI